VRPGRRFAANEQYGGWGGKVTDATSNDANGEVPAEAFCIRQLKPFVALCVALTIAVIGWTAYSARLDAIGIAEQLSAGSAGATAMRVATAPPIQAGVKAPHPNWGACTNCHSIVATPGAAGAKPVAANMMVATAPPIQAGAKPTHPNWGACTNCHSILPAATATPPAAMPVATAPAILAGAKPPHPAWGKCTMCHNIIQPQNATPAAAKAAPPLGIWLRPLSSTLANELGLLVTDGVYVSGVSDAAPAKAAGLKPGDVICRIDNIDVDTVNDALAILSQKGPKDTVKLQVIQDGRRRNIYVPITPDAVTGNLGEAPTLVANISANQRVAVAATSDAADAQVAPVFRSAPVFWLFDPTRQLVTAIDSPLLAGGSEATFAQTLTNAGVGSVIVGSIGPSSLSRLRASGLRIYSGAFGAVSEVLVQYRRGLLREANNSAVAAPPVAPSANRLGTSTVAVAATRASLQADVAADLGTAPYLVLYDPKNGRARAVATGLGNAAAGETLVADLLVEQQAQAVIAGNISPTLVARLNSMGVFAFAGVAGSVSGALDLLQRGQLQVTTVNTNRVAMGVPAAPAAQAMPPAQGLLTF
jgi:predicted Fe-Mo cluster-binding NifX family protein